VEKAGVYYQSASLDCGPFHCGHKFIVARRRYDSFLGLGGGLGSLLGGGLGGGGGRGGGLDDLGLLLDGGNLTTHLGDLAGGTLLLADLVLGAASVTLGLDLGNADLLSLQLVDGLHKDVLVLELVTLGGEVKLVVDVLVDLLGVTVLLEEAAEDASTADLEHLGGHTGITGTLLVTSTLVTALALLGLVSLYAAAGVHEGLASDDKTILVELSDVLAGVSKSNFLALIGVDPNSLLSALEDGSSKSSLQSKHCHFSYETYLIIIIDTPNQYPDFTDS